MVLKNLKVCQVLTLAVTDRTRSILRTVKEEDTENYGWEYNNYIINLLQAQFRWWRWVCAVRSYKSNVMLCLARQKKIKYWRDHVTRIHPNREVRMTFEGTPANRRLPITSLDRSPNRMCLNGGNTVTRTHYPKEWTSKQSNFINISSYFTFYEWMRNYPYFFWNFPC